MTIESRPPAFEEFFSREYVRLVKGCWMLTRSRVEAEELAQEAMVRAFENWAKVEQAENPVAYVYTIAVHAHRRHLHKLIRASLRSDLDSGQDMESEIVERRLVRDAVTQLPRQQREALVLTEWAGMSYEEAASILRRPASTIRGRAYRAREALRQTIGDLHGHQ
jgi:RNA polymerase sigma-70 factor (ECF subfamily)